jgi:predicted deacylase
LRLLAHLGVIDTAPPPTSPTRLMRVTGPSHFVYAAVRGLFEPAFTLGDVVQKNGLAGHIHFPEEPGRAPHDVHFSEGGVVVCRRVPSGVVPGDCLAHLAIDL